MKTRSSSNWEGRGGGGAVDNVGIPCRQGGGVDGQCEIDSESIVKKMTADEDVDSILRLQAWLVNQICAIDVMPITKNKKIFSLDDWLT